MKSCCQKSIGREFPCCPVGRTSHFHCRDLGLIPGWGSHVAWPKKVNMVEGKNIYFQLLASLSFPLSGQTPESASLYPILQLLPKDMCIYIWKFSILKKIGLLKFWITKPVKFSMVFFGCIWNYQTSPISSSCPFSDPLHLPLGLINFYLE